MPKHHLLCLEQFTYKPHLRELETFNKLTNIDIFKLYMYLFAFFSEYTWRSKRRQRNYASLKNNANNCWFNATVQALAHDAFGDWLLGKAWTKKKKENLVVEDREEEQLKEYRFKVPL